MHHLLACCHRAWPCWICWLPCSSCPAPAHHAGGQCCPAVSNQADARSHILCVRQSDTIQVPENYCQHGEQHRSAKTVLTAIQPLPAGVSTAPCYHQVLPHASSSNSDALAGQLVRCSCKTWEKRGGDITAHATVPSTAKQASPEQQAPPCTCCHQAATSPQCHQSSPQHTCTPQAHCRTGSTSSTAAAAHRQRGTTVTKRAAGADHAH